MSEAHELANKGYMVIAGWENPVPNDSGHVAVIVPGEMVKSNSWDCFVPLTLDTESRARQTAGKLSQGFGRDKKDKIKFYVYEGAINKQQISMLKKYKYFLIAISVIIVGIVLYKNCSGKMKKPIPIVYNQQHIRKLEKIDETQIYWKERGLLLKKVDELEDSLASAYQLSGENGIGWNEEAGDFARIKIKLSNGYIAQFDNDLGGWMTILEKIKITSNSPKIKNHPYGITLDMGEGDQILILVGTTPDIFLTLIYIGKDTAEVIFNKEIVSLLEITEKGYRLKGKLYFNEYLDWEDIGMATSYPGQQFEIFISRVIMD